MISIRKITTGESHIWEDFLKENPLHHAFSFHWKSIIESVFGHRGYYLVAEDSQTKTVLGILPLFHFKSILFGSALVSVPYLNAGGIHAISEEASAELYNHTCKLAESLDVKYVELRHQGSSQFPYPKATIRTHKVSMRLSLSGSPEEIFQNFPPKLRSQIRRPSKSGCYAEISGHQLDIEESLSAFYKVFSKHMRDLGTPVYPKNLFSETVKQFGNDSTIYTVWHDGHPISAAITINTGTYTEVPWAASLTGYNKYSPNMLLYWEIIKNSAQNGTKMFDFGRSSPDSGTFKFKQQWGAAPLELSWYYPEGFKGIPDVNPANKKFAPLVTCWKCLPLFAANTLGPWLTRSIP